MAPVELVLWSPRGIAEGWGLPSPPPQDRFLCVLIGSMWMGIFLSLQVRYVVRPEGVERRRRFRRRFHAWHEMGRVVGYRIEPIGAHVKSESGWAVRDRRTGRTLFRIGPYIRDRRRLVGILREHTKAGRGDV